MSSPAAPLAVVARLLLIQQHVLSLRVHEGPRHAWVIPLCDIKPPPPLPRALLMLCTGWAWLSLHEPSWGQPCWPVGQLQGHHPMHDQKLSNRIHRLPNRSPGRNGAEIWMVFP